MQDADYRLGERISFGGLEWIVLRVSGWKLLVVTCDIVEKRAFHSAFEDVDWKTCSLRAYLNGEFFSRFSESDRERIQRDAETEDRIFLLGIDEAKTCFADETLRIGKFRGAPRWWYLQTPGIGKHVAFVDKEGDVNEHGCRVDDPYCGVRPAIYLNI